MDDRLSNRSDWFCPQACCQTLMGSVDEILSREWLLTNGLGGYASATVVGCPTRRYHGLMVSAGKPPLGRNVLLANVFEKVVIDGAAIELATFEFNDKFHPNGVSTLKDFDYHLGPANPFVQFIYQLGDVEIRKRLSMVHGHDLVTLAYDVTADPSRVVEFDLMPFMAMRDFHTLRRRTATEPFFVETDEHCALWVSDRLDPTLSIAALPSTGGGAELLQFDSTTDWWLNFRYRVETQRGQESGEDLFAPGWWRGRVRGSGRLSWTFVAGSTGLHDARAITEAAARTVSEEPDTAIVGDLLLGELHRAAAQFVVRRPMAGGRKSTTILAGYHWFGDWGRDAFIALPGLMLETQRFAQAREVLCTFAEARADGLIPNRFSDEGVGLDYNSVDAALWFIHAADAYVGRTGDTATWRDVLLPACHDIIEHYRLGTQFEIAMDDDGLIRCGNATTQLTWMDAKQGDIAFTPRYGKPVEIQALWHHALCVLARRCADDGDQDAASTYQQLADRTAESFVRAFWNDQDQCLYDCVQLDENDAAIRPNQIFAVSLPDSPLTAAQQRRIVSCVGEHLLTPMGLRTLSPEDPAYRGCYAGNPFERDAAYHQGTVWAWLIGPYIEAYLRAHNFSGEARDHCRSLLRPLQEHLAQAGLGQISEIFDGDAPHQPKGCIAQAWSVAEVIRAHHLITARVAVPAGG